MTQREQQPPSRILYFVSQFPCISETFIVNEIQGMIDAGVDIRILSLKAADLNIVHPAAKNLLDRVIYPLPPLQSLAQGVQSILQSPLSNIKLALQIFSAFWKNPIVLLKTFIAYWRALALLKTISKWNPEWIHAHWATYSSTAGLAIANALDLPFSFTSHSHDIFPDSQLLKEKYKAAAFTATISKHNLSRIKNHVSESLVNQKTKVIHCGIYLNHYPFDRSQQKPQEIISVGRLMGTKGFDILIQACAKLREKGIPFHCTIIGEGFYRERLEKLIHTLDLKDCVQLLGAKSQEEVRLALLQSSVFVLPAVIDTDGKAEGIPVCLMEAMASGTPVGSTRLSGIPELIEDGENGFLTTPGSVDELTEQLQNLFSDLALREKFALNARKTIEASFNAEHEAKRLLEEMRNHFSDQG